MNEINDRVVESFKEGDEEAFNMIYKHYYKKLYFYVLQSCSDEGLVEDIVQNTFALAYRSRNNLKSNGAFHSWLFRIAHHEMIRIVRKESLKSKNTATLLDVENVINKKETQIDERVINKEIFSSINHNIQLMKPKHKNVAILRYYYELSNQEIAHVLSIPEGTVKSRLSRINKKLQRSLIREGYSIGIERAGIAISLMIPTILKSININIPPEVVKKTALIGTVETTKNIWTIKKIIATILASTGIMGGIYIYLNQGDDTSVNGIIKIHDKVEIEVPCRIKNVIFDSAYTALSIPIKVETTNDIYDKFLVNSEVTNTISENGQYVIELIKDDLVIDTYTIEVNNIDRIAPQVVSVNSSDNEYKIVLNDEHSGLNIPSLRYRVNENISNNYIFDTDSNTLYFFYEEGTINVFYIEDNAGNWKEFTFE
ncbi:MAG: RNA polymerase sigma factor [Coprobacillaceae bacterium]